MGNQKSSGRKPRVTMAMVGRLAGVSQGTVSRALAHPEKVSAETLGRIRTAIATTGFVPDALAEQAANTRSKLVSALIPSLTNIVYSSFVTSFAEQLRGRGYQLLLSETGLDPAVEETLIAAHLSRRPDAMLLTGIQHSARARRMLQSADMPVVEAWDITDSPIDICVGFNHVKAGRAVANYLHDRGHCSAATITADDARSQRRQSAFAESFTRVSGGPVPDARTGGIASIGAGRRALADLIDRQGVTSAAIFCSSDLLAHGALIEARARRLAVPGDLAIVGFGDQDFARDLDPPLTSVLIDRPKLGTVAAEALLQRIDGIAPVRRVFDLGFRIVRRASA